MSWCTALAATPPCQIDHKNHHLPRCAVAKHRAVGERLASLTCLAELEAEHGLHSAVRTCCRNATVLSASWSSPMTMKWPHAYVAALAELRKRSTRDIDFSFIGSMGGDSLTLERRKWVARFAGQFFTNASFFVDTYASARPYQPLGPWDRTLNYGGGFRPKAPLHSTSARACARSACDLDYFSVLARSKFTLAPMGDQPWSHRYFESVFAGSVPIVESHLHSGRTPAERALGYHHLLLSAARPPAGDSGGDGGGDSGASTVPYCAESAEHNLRIFLREQTMAGAAVRPDTKECLQPPYALRDAQRTTDPTTSSGSLSMPTQARPARPPAAAGLGQGGMAHAAVSKAAASAGKSRTVRGRRHAAAAAMAARTAPPPRQARRA